MPEPNFNQIAADWCYREDSRDVSDIEGMRAEFVAMLRQVWNAGYIAGESAHWDDSNRPSIDKDGRVQIQRFAHHRAKTDASEA